MSEPRRRPSRRQFLQRAAMLGVGAPTLAAFLDACARSTGDHATPSGSLTLAAPTNPVSWSVDKSALIADGLKPEQGGTLRLYNYADYIDPGALKSFEKK